MAYKELSAGLAFGRTISRGGRFAFFAETFRQYRIGVIAQAAVHAVSLGTKAAFEFGVNVNGKANPTLFGRHYPLTSFFYDFC